MKTLIVRETREGLSHPEHMFADKEEALVGCRDKPVARILPVKSKPKARSLEWWRIMPYQNIGTRFWSNDAGGVR